MTIITISRGSFSGGKMLADCLAEHLNYRCIDRDVVVEKAVAAYGSTHEELRDALLKAPSLWDRFKHKKYVYLALFQAALAEEVRGGQAVYHGNAGHLLLRGVSHVLRARIVAPLDFRVAQVRERLKLGREDAVAHIQRMDQDRTRWTQFLYGVNWGDPSLYDIVLNLENADIRESCETIVSLARARCFAETPESVLELGNLALASRVRATLVMDPETAHLEVEVEANSGVVNVRGRVKMAAEHLEVERVASRVRGVTAINVDDLVVYRDV